MLPSDFRLYHEAALQELHGLACPNCRTDDGLFLRECEGDPVCIDCGWGNFVGQIAARRRWLHCPTCNARVMTVFNWRDCPREERVGCTSCGWTEEG